MALLKRALFLALIGYLGVAALLTSLQRYIIFPAPSDATLAAVNWQAIAGHDRFFIETADGEKLSAWYAPPKTGKPVFLFFHGNGGRLELMSQRWQYILDQGYGIFTLSYRGYPGSTGSPSEEGLIADAQAGWKWLSQKHTSQEIVIHGMSLGSGVATALARDVKAKALVLEAPFSALVDVADHQYPWLPTRLLTKDPFLSRERIAQVNMPVFIAHGTQDRVIPFHLGEKLFKHAVEPKSLVQIDGGGHNTLVRDGLYSHIWDFLDRLPAN